MDSITKPEEEKSRALKHLRGLKLLIAINSFLDYAAGANPNNNKILSGGLAIIAFPLATTIGR